MVTTIAGLSTLIGMIPIYIKFKNTNRLICISLSFAAGVMLSVSIFSLLPESFDLLRNELRIIPSIVLMLIFFLVGILISSILDRIFQNLNNKLYKIGIINTLALMIHNIPEGILTFSTTTNNISLGLTLALSIMCHNIPEGISISVPIYYSTKSRKKVFFYTAISGFSEVLGAVLTYLFLYKFINDYFIGVILSLTIGIMVHISLFELFPNSMVYKMKKTSFLAFLVGFLLMMVFK